MSRVVVRIENPPPGFREATSLDRARRYERRGQARFVAPLVIRFNETRVQAVIVSSAEEKLHEDRVKLSRPGYDRVNRLFFSEARAIPVISAEKMIREEKSSRNWSYSAGVRRSLRPDHTSAQVAQIRAEQVHRPTAPLSLVAACAGTL